MYIAHRGTLDIDSLDTLRDLLRDVPAARRDYRSVTVSLPGLAPDERAGWEARLSGHLRTRGTDAAAVGYGSTLLLYGLYLWLDGLNLAAGFDVLSVGVALVVGGAAVGKMLGLVLANRALHRAASALGRRLRAGAEGGGPVGRDGTSAPVVALASAAELGGPPHMLASTPGPDFTRVA